jgi:UDP-N-acetylmuramate dehydrogenase
VNGNGIGRLVEELTARGYGRRLQFDEPMARHTSFAIGGPADVLVVVDVLHELVELVGMAQECEVPCMVVGGGTNILVADAGVRGLVVVNRCGAYHIDGEGLVIAESGVLLHELACWAVTEGWAGLEWAVGIPGTLGGAVVGNAGAYGGTVGERLRWARLLRPNGQEEQVEATGLGYGYRTSALKREALEGRRSVVLDVALQLEPADAHELAVRAAHVTQQRRARTPRGSCAGSVFKRTPQYPAGFLIEQAGLKGKRIGGAVVSEKHANFLLNADRATAADMRALISLVQDEVWSTFGQRLEPEIEFIGDWSRAGSPLAEGSGHNGRCNAAVSS